jgi:hypothetical protein
VPSIWPCGALEAASGSRGTLWRARLRPVHATELVGRFMSCSPINKLREFDMRIKSFSELIPDWLRARRRPDFSTERNGTRDGEPDRYAGPPRPIQREPYRPAPPPLDDINRNL